MSGVAYFQEIKRLRRSGMVTLTLTDLLIVVVFVLLLFTFRSGEENRAEISASQEHEQRLAAERDRLSQELADSQRENGELKQQVRELQELVQRLLKGTMDTLPADPGETTAELEAENRELKNTIGQLSKEVERLKELRKAQQAKGEENGESQGKDGGTGYARCPIAPGFLFEVRLLESGNLGITPRWEEAANSNARAVPGVSELADAGEVSLDTFRQLAGRILEWSDAQKTPCRFHVDTRTETKNLDTYRRQMSAIDRYFYPTRK